MEVRQLEAPMTGKYLRVPSKDNIFPMFFAFEASDKTFNEDPQQMFCHTELSFVGFY